MNNSDTLFKAAAWAGIIACVITLLSYMGFNPFMNEANQEETVIQSENVETNKDEVATLNDNIESNKESSIDNNLVENTKDNDIINLETAKDLTFWEFLSIPFKQHEKINFLFVDNKLFVLITLALIYIAIAGIWGLLNLWEVALVGTTIEDKLLWIILFLAALFCAYCGLAFCGVF